MNNQRQRIKQLFIDRTGEWIPVPEIFRLAAQYNARIYELRAEGMDIENKTEIRENGVKYSWYCYTSPIKQMELAL